MSEEWRPVVGYEGWYEVSNAGRVRRVRRGYGTWPGRVLRPSPTSRGYAGVDLGHGEPSGKTVHIHRLVLEAFVGPPPSPKHEANHIDRNRMNCALENLEWVTAKENNRHSYDARKNAMPRGERHHNARLTTKVVLAIRSEVGLSYSSLAAKYSISVANVANIMCRRTWKGVEP